VKRKAAWAAAGMIPTLIAANYMPRFVLYAFSAVLFIAVIVLAFFRWRGRMVRTFFLVTCACVAASVFLFHYERVNMPVREYCNERISAKVLFIDENEDYWTVRIQSASCNNNQIGLTGLMGIAVYDVSIEPYSVGNIDFTLGEKEEGSTYNFTAKDIVLHEINPQQSSIFLRSIKNFRQEIIDLIQVNVGGEEGNLASAFLTGDKQELSYHTRVNFRKAGLTHVMAVSGLHLSVFLGMLNYLLEKLSVNKKIISLGSILLVAFVAILANFSVSVLRAGLMSLIMLVGEICNRRADALNSLGLSMIGIALVSPLEVLDASYLLSGAATAGILLLSPILEKWLMSKCFVGSFYRKQLTLICVSVSSAIFTAPILLIFFRAISIFSVPAMSIVNYPVTIVLIGSILLCCLAWIPFLGEFIAFIVHLVSGLILDIVDLLSSFDQAVISFHSLPMIVCAVLLGLLGLSIYLLRSRPKFRRIVSAIVCVFIMLSLMAAQVYHTVFSRLIVMGDYGECNIFIDQNKVIVVNCGNAYLAGLAQSRIKECGFDNIDLLIVTGLDSNYTQGVPALLSSIHTNKILVPGKLRSDETYRYITDAANRANADIALAEQEVIINADEISVKIYDLDTNDNDFYAIVNSPTHSVGFFSAIDRQILNYCALVPKGDLFVDTLVIGVGADKEAIDPLLIYTTQPESVVVNMSERFPYTLTDQEIRAISGGKAQYHVITPVESEYILNYQMG
jgi:ComEC/Rec2-related protein